MGQGVTYLQGVRMVAEAIAPAAFLLEGCGILESPLKTLNLGATGVALVLDNQPGDTGYFTALGRNASAYVEWGSFIDSRHAIGRGRTQFEPVSRVYREGDEREILVCRWHAELVNGAAVPGDIHTESITLP